MAHLSDMLEKQRNMIVNQGLPDYDDTPCVDGPALSERKIAIITTASLHRRDDTVFTPGVGEYRIIPDDTDMNDLIMNHVSTNFDRTGFQQDLNLVFPIERLRELQASGDIGEVASYHYAFMGATPPTAFEAVAKDLAGILKSDNITGVLLAGV